MNSSCNMSLLRNNYTSGTAIIARNIIDKGKDLMVAPAKLLSHFSRV